MSFEKNRENIYNAVKNLPDNIVVIEGDWDGDSGGGGLVSLLLNNSAMGIISDIIWELLDMGWVNFTIINAQ